MQYLRIGFLGLCTLLLLVEQALASEQVDFTLPDLQGKSYTLSDYRGKWVLVNYWATWCPPCRKELPELEMFHVGAKGKAVVLAVNMEEIEAQPLQEFLKDQFLSYPILVAGPRPSKEQRVGPVPALPTSYLVSPQGKVVARQVGSITAEAIRSFIDSYEKQPAS